VKIKKMKARVWGMRRIDLRWERGGTKFAEAEGREMGQKERPYKVRQRGPKKGNLERRAESR